MMNIFTEPDFQEAFKKWQKHWEHCIHEEADYFEGDFSQMTAPVPKIMDNNGRT
jgi:hypothetical protein